MTKKLKTVIKDLSKLYDEDSQDVFVSVYLNRQDDKNFLQKRIHACEVLLQKDEQKNFSNTIARIDDFLQSSKEKNIAIFASANHDIFIPVPLPIDIVNLFIVDSSPYIRPLARIIDEWESFDLILINSHQAKIFTIELGQAEQKKRLSSDIINKHKKGGWSQARFQRLRKGAIHDFYTEVISYLEQSEPNQMILAGPGVSKLQFKELLPKALDEKIIEVIDFSMDHEADLIKQSVNIISGKEEEKSHEIVQQVKQEILKDGLAVYGFDETLEAAQNGQIDVLLVEKDYRVKGCLCEHCQIVKTGPIKDCPICGGPTTEADVIEEIIEFAERTDAKIEFTNAKEISLLGHIAGLLRYKIENT